MDRSSRVVALVRGAALGTVVLSAAVRGAGAQQGNVTHVETASVSPDVGDEAARALLASLRARVVTVDFDRVTVRQALKMIAAQSGVQIVYQRQVVDGVTASRSLHVRDSLGRVLDRVLAGTSLQVIGLPGTGLGVVGNGRANAATEGIISGTVAASALDPLPPAKG